MHFFITIFLSIIFITSSLNAMEHNLQECFVEVNENVVTLRNDEEERTICLPIAFQNNRFTYRNPYVTEDGDYLIIEASYRNHPRIIIICDLLHEGTPLYEDLLGHGQPSFENNILIYQTNKREHTSIDFSNPQALIDIMQSSSNLINDNNLSSFCDSHITFDVKYLKKGIFLLSYRQLILGATALAGIYGIYRFIKSRNKHNNESQHDTINTKFNSKHT